MFTSEKDNDQCLIIQFETGRSFNSNERGEISLVGKEVVEKF